jgi:DNA invertase Pin-like site-specific DNA recombinase
MEKHGGSRIGAGRPATSIDVRRAQALRQQGLSYAEIGKRFGVTRQIIIRALQKLHKEKS